MSDTNSNTYSGVNHHGELSEYVKKAVSQEIIEWYRVEPNLELMRYFLCQIAKPFFMPCFWPHFCACLPCLFGFAYCAKVATEKATVVLTETSVCFIVEPTIIWGWFPTSGGTSTIQLFQISDVLISENPPFCYSPGMTSMKIVADNAGFSMIGTSQLQEFKTALVKQQQIISRHIGGAEAPVSSGTGSSGGESSHEKLAGLKKMLDDGLISQSEFDEEKKIILAKLTS